MKLDPEEQIIAAALDEADGRGAEAWIEFLRGGRATVTIAISRDLITKAVTLDRSTGELFAEAVRISVPGVFSIEAPGKAPHAA